MAPDLQRFELFSALDTLLCCPYFAVVDVAAVENQAEYKPDSGSVPIWFPVVLFHHMKSFHGFLVLGYSV